MMSRGLQFELTKAVMELRTASPFQFDNFMKILAQRIEEVTEKMVASPPEELANYQGRAQEARELFRAIHDAPKLAQELQNKSKQVRGEPDGRGIGTY